MRENYFALALWQWIEASNILKYKHLRKELQRYVEYKNQVITSYYRGNWSHLRRIQKVSEQHIGKGHEGIKENSHNGHCIHTEANANVKEQKVYQEK